MRFFFRRSISFRHHEIFDEITGSCHQLMLIFHGLQDNQEQFLNVHLMFRGDISSTLYVQVAPGDKSSILRNQKGRIHFVCQSTHINRIST